MGRPATAIVLTADDRTTLTLNAVQNFLHYPEDQSEIALTSIDGRLNYQMAPGLQLILSARWRNTDDSRRGGTMGFEEQAELRWKVRQTTIFGLVRHTSLETRDYGASSLFF